MCGDGEAELGLVMLAYIEFFVFSAETLFFKTFVRLDAFLVCSLIYACVCICLQVFLSRTIPMTV